MSVRSKPVPFPDLEGPDLPWVHHLSRALEAGVHTGGKLTLTLAPHVQDHLSSELSRAYLGWSRAMENISWGDLLNLSEALNGFGRVVISRRLGLLLLGLRRFLGMRIQTPPCASGPRCRRNYLSFGYCYVVEHIHELYRTSDVESMRLMIKCRIILRVCLPARRPSGGELS